MCVHTWGNEKGEVKEQITATLISTQEHDKSVREQFDQNGFLSGEHDIPFHKLKANFASQGTRRTVDCPLGWHGV